jgi:tetratricopeptide (TPR) repeat protein
MLLSVLALAAVFAAAQDAPPVPAASPTAEAAPSTAISAGTGKAAAATAPAPAPVAAEAPKPARSAEAPGAAAEAASAPPSASPQSASALVQAGLNAYRKRRYAAAEIEFRKALDADPASAAAAYYLGYTYYKQAERKRPFHAEKQRAAELFARAYELDARFVPAWGR